MPLWFLSRQLCVFDETKARDCPSEEPERLLFSQGGGAGENARLSTTRVPKGVVDLLVKQKAALSRLGII